MMEELIKTAFKSAIENYEEQIFENQGTPERVFCYERTDFIWRRFSWAHIKADWRRYQRQRAAKKERKHWEWVNGREVR
jgi:hypothetical protein